MIGRNSPVAPAATTYLPKLSGQHAVVAQDGQQGAQRGGRQGDGDRDEGVDESDRVEGSRRSPSASTAVIVPCRQRQPPEAFPEQPRVQLGTGEEEDETQARRWRTARRWPDRRCRSTCGPRRSAAEDQHHHLRHPVAGDHRGHKRRQRRHDREQTKRVDAAGQVVHDDAFIAEPDHPRRRLPRPGHGDDQPSSSHFGSVSTGSPAWAAHAKLHRPDKSPAKAYGPTSVDDQR